MVHLLEPAPDFVAQAARGAGEAVEVRLSALRGRWVVLFFYPKDFTTVCPTEVIELGKRMPELRALSAEALALSVDELATHRRWIEEVLGPLALPLVADADRAIARAYGALQEPDGVASRATYLIDPAGLVQYAAFQPRRVGRSISEIIRVLEALQTGERAPAEWRPGQPTLGR